LTREKVIIRDNSTLRTYYNSLQQGDIVVGRLRLRESEESMLLDLGTRGVHLIPAGLSQLVSRSKTLQATIFSKFMLPQTRAIHALHDLIEAIPEYQKISVTAVITKQDRGNAGLGVHLWQSIEEVFTHASLGNLPFPFVLQPFEPECRDIRVVLLDDYSEAYWRHNPHSFRNNLHHGGTSEPCKLSREQAELCQRVMDRGHFPYAHIDILVTGKGKSFLGEVNLRGGLQGAKISPEEYQKKVEAIHQKLLKNYLD
jgi:glutathione synthase/RimK-type ligase-like ATP-grasp enzyme